MPLHPATRGIGHRLYGVELRPSLLDSPQFEHKESMPLPILDRLAADVLERRWFMALLAGGCSRRVARRRGTVEVSVPAARAGLYALAVLPRRSSAEQVDWAIIKGEGEGDSPGGWRPFTSSGDRSNSTVAVSCPTRHRRRTGASVAERRFAALGDESTRNEGCRAEGTGEIMASRQPRKEQSLPAKT